jgi:hypothetical protein
LQYSIAAIGLLHLGRDKGHAGTLPEWPLRIPLAPSWLIAHAAVAKPPALGFMPDWVVHSQYIPVHSQRDGIVELLACGFKHLHIFSWLFSMAVLK